MASRTRCSLDDVSPVYSRAATVDFIRHAKQHLRVQILRESSEDVEFEVIGLDAPITNALRRILLAEVPSIAIESVYVHNNTSIVQDEVLSHRMGLVPLRVDPRKLAAVPAGEPPSDQDSLVFTLKAVGKPFKLSAAEANALEGEDDVSSKYTPVYSGEIVWEPQGDQLTKFGADGVGTMHGDILLTKLAPGQAVDLFMIAHKGIGKDHAKFSPVCTASYRMLPSIELSIEAPFFNDEAESLASHCPAKVFDVEDLAGGKRRAVVARPRDCTLCRECIRDPAWAERVKLERINDHFVFCVESVGSYPPRDLLKEALNVLAAKARSLSASLTAILSNGKGVLGAADTAKATLAAMTTEPDSLA